MQSMISSLVHPRAAVIFVLTLIYTHAHAFSPISNIARCGGGDGPFSLSTTTRYATPSHQGGALPQLPDIRAAVIVPGFLTGKDDFLPLAQSLCNIGIPAVVVPMPNWHWLPCLGGRSMRPMLERIDFTVRHLGE